jgi:hypothetical protein
MKFHNKTKVLLADRQIITHVKTLLSRSKTKLAEETNQEKGHQNITVGLDRGQNRRKKTLLIKMSLKVVFSASVVYFRN